MRRFTCEPEADENPSFIFWFDEDEGVFYKAPPEPGLKKGLFRPNPEDRKNAVPIADPEIEIHPPLPKTVDQLPDPAPEAEAGPEKNGVLPFGNYDRGVLVELEKTNKTLVGMAKNLAGLYRVLGENGG